MGIIRKTYDWVLGWASSPWGAVALFVLAFAESSFFPIPPDVLLIALCLGASARSFRYALICTLGSVLGAMAGYAIGFYLWQNSAGEYTSLAHFFFNHVFSEQTFMAVGEKYELYNFWIVFTAGFTPIPFKVITITAGVFNIEFVMFVVASVISRGLRFCLIAGLIWKFGAPIKSFIDRYFNLLAFIFTVLLIGSFVLIKYMV